jgi:hypothetical protein
VNAQGEPTVSHKGGAVGVVTVVDSYTLAFPSYDGSGMFLSMGNIAEAASPYVPDKNGETPFPVWKRIELVQDALPSKDTGQAVREGGVITQEEYGAKLAAGES